MACLLLATASSGFAQHISVGIKAGVPFTGLLGSNYGGWCCQELRHKRSAIPSVR